MIVLYLLKIAVHQHFLLISHFPTSDYKNYYIFTPDMLFSAYH